MLERLLPYYERELAELRHLGAEFAKRFPRVARRLGLERDPCEDPHVERLVEAFAFLAARIHQRLEDDCAEVSGAFLEAMFPGLTRPVPSMSIVQFESGSAGSGTPAPLRLARGRDLALPHAQGPHCRFRTCYDVDLLPLRVTEARLEMAHGSEEVRRAGAAAALVLEFGSQGRGGAGSPGGVPLRFFLDCEPAFSALLYELLGTALTGVRARGDAKLPGSVRELPPRSLRPMGLRSDESLLGEDSRIPAGQRLLAEYFAFPEKFLFFELSGLEGLGTLREVRLLLSRYGDSDRHKRLAASLAADHFRLGCTPVVNLFSCKATPIRVSHRSASYPVIVDPRYPDAYEVHSVDRVVCDQDGVAREGCIEIPCVHSMGPASGAEGSRYFWTASRRPSPRAGDRGTDLELSLVDMAFQPLEPVAGVLSLDLTCTNRDLAGRIPSTPGAWQEGFSMDGRGTGLRARLLHKPTPSLRPPSGDGYQWRLISALATQVLGEEVLQRGGLQRLLELHNLAGSITVARQIQGIAGIRAEAATARVAGLAFPCFVRGSDLHICFDEGCYAGSNLFLFAAVLEQFFAHSCAPNTFIRFHMSTRQREGEVARWPAKSGESVLI